MVFYSVCVCSATMTRFLKSLNNVSEEYLEKCFGNERIYCIASGQMNNEIKFYLHAKHVNDNKIVAY